ncbi:galactonate dehydratase [Pseudonocardia sp. HH130630-07]|uniref:galactonate dehydratase n=1 Tax=Pseudonocardia sp. HH130630-07 TaxID=1690815 RepID=UPI0008152340|nr:galactonate dehydratase [Pseudonocardia sp. HH130630-07]ANY06268.1 D-galactonate dehydratase [Pseudonocardia sp. HH130630-07]
MRIARLETFLVAPRWVFLRLETDDGLVGWGEPVVEGRAHTVVAAVEELADVVIGADATRIEDLWQVMTRGAFYRGGPVFSSAVSGIDQALWDVRGKALGVPVHDLLGGAVRDRVRMYGWIGGDDPSEVGEAAAARVAAGYTAVKMNAGGRMRPVESVSEVREVVERVAAVREVLGPDRDVAVDFHGRVSPALARVLCRELEPLHPMFVEEPVVPELSGELARICDSTTIPIATGERLFSRWDFAPVLRSGIAIAQPDLSHAGGISESRRIAAAAETHGVAVAPHCPLGPIALAACLQLDLAAPNALIQETSLGIHYNVGGDTLDHLLDPGVFALDDAGNVGRLTGPGLGIEIDEAAVRRAAEDGHRWRNPVWRHADGSLAEW